MLKKLKRTVKNLLAIVWIRKTYELVNRFVLELAAANRLFATLYSIIGLLTFNREQYAILRARRNYYRNLSKKRRSHVELRRNIHRLEKGILMRPRRDVFARDYIYETVEYYERAVLQYKSSPDSIDELELTWANDVLRKYFSLIKADDNAVNAAKLKFESLKDYYSSRASNFPYERADGVKSDIRYSQLLKLSQQRRSVRWFLDKKVSRKLLDQAMMVARQAPTACNRLPYEFKIFDDPKLVRKVANIPFGASGYANNVPVIIVVVGKLSDYFSPRDRHAIYIDSSLAAMSFMLALETLGLASTVINWPDFEPLERKMQKSLNLDYDERVVMLMAVGYPDPKGMVACSKKKSLNVVRSYNEIF